MTPSELLVALLSINPSTHAVPLKPLMAAVSACLQDREQFTNEALGAALQQAVQWSPLPPLFMRTVLQAHGVAPELKPFLLTNILTPLLGKQVHMSCYVVCCSTNVATVMMLVTLMIMAMVITQ